MSKHCLVETSDEVLLQSAGLKSSFIGREQWSWGFHAAEVTTDTTSRYKVTYAVKYTVTYTSTGHGIEISDIAAITFIAPKRSKKSAAVNLLLGGMRSCDYLPLQFEEISLL